MDFGTLSQLSADLQGIDSNTLVSGLSALGPLAVVGLVVAIMMVMGKISGWGRLAERYSATGPVPGTIHRFRSARIGWASYNNCLTVGGDMRGLYIAMFPLFRPGHPPLYIPWHDVEARAGSSWVVSYLDFRFPQVPDVRVRVLRSLGDAVIRESGGQISVQEGDGAGSQKSAFLPFARS